MKFKTYNLDDYIIGAILIVGSDFEDHRGTFCETFNSKDFKDLGLPTHWEQDSLSTSKANVIRGLHYQTKNPQGKLVRCIHGEILDVGVDIRMNSATFGKSLGIPLSGSKNRALYLPPGTAHGFAAKTDCVVSYKCTTRYDAKTDTGIYYADSYLEIDWATENPILSDKDLGLPRLSELKTFWKNYYTHDD